MCSSSWVFVLVLVLVLVWRLPPSLLLIPEKRGGSLRAVLVYRIGFRLTGGCLCGLPITRMDVDVIWYRVGVILL